MAVFGTKGDPSFHEPGSEGKSASPTEPPSPADGRQPEGAEATETPTAKEGTPGEVLPGDDILSEFSQFEEKPETVQPEAGKDALVEALDTDEKIAKAINPDGKTPADQQLKNAQSLIGKHGRAIGDLNKKLRAHEQIASTLTGLYRFVDTPQGKRAIPTAKGALNLINQVPPEEFQAEMDTLGLMVVPKGWKGEGSDKLTDIEEAAKALVPGEDLTVEERLAQIQGDPKLKAMYDRDIMTREIQRTQEQRDRQIAEGLRKREAHLQNQRETQEADSFYKTQFETLKKLPYYSEIQPVLVRWIDKLNELAPDMPRDLRFKLAVGQAQLSRTKNAMKQYGDLRAKHERETLARSMALGGLDNTAQPMFVDTPEGQDAHRQAESRKANASKAEMAKAFV